VLEVGDLVTVDSEALRLHVHTNVHKQWSFNKLGIVIAIEGHKDGAVVLVKVHFESLGGAYWLYAHEVLSVNPTSLEDK